MNKFLFLAPLPVFLTGCGARSTSQNAPAPAQIVQQAAKREAKAAAQTLSKLSGAVMKGGELRGGDAKGRPLWSVAANEIRTSGALEGGLPQKATLSNARATLFREGQPETTFKAPEIVLFNSKNGPRLQMTHGMTGQSVGNWTGKRGAVQMSAPRADIDVQKRLIVASGGVHLSQGEVKVSGQTLRAQTSLQTVAVSQNVRASSSQGQLRAQTAIYDWKNARVRAQTVAGTHLKTQISGDNLSADTRLSRGVLSGHVIAQSEQGRADAPKLDFDWQSDQITAQDATFSGEGGTLRAATLRTDSKLRVASVTGLTAQKDGATLRAAFADGFQSLSRWNGRGVSFSRADTHFSAPRVIATQLGSSWVLTATGGARGQNSSGQVRAPRVVWNEAQNRVEASGGVQFEKDGAVLSGSHLICNTKFGNATLTGAVRGRLRDGSTLSSGVLEKRGDRFFATNGATAHLQSRGAAGALTVRANRVEAAADGSSATATGNVTVLSATGATARAPRAVYDRKSGRVTATGGVDFFDPTRGLRQHGDTLVADLNLSRANLSNVRGQGNGKLFEGKSLF